jgi:hypothetical protein
MENLKWNNRLGEPRESDGQFLQPCRIGTDSQDKTRQDKTRYHNSKTRFKLKLAHSPV